MKSPAQVERNLLIRLAEEAQAREGLLKRSIELLLAAGHLSQERLDQAKALATPTPKD